VEPTSANVQAKMPETGSTWPSLEIQPRKSNSNISTMDFGRETNDYDLPQ